MFGHILVRHVGHAAARPFRPVNVTGRRASLRAHFSTTTTTTGDPKVAPESSSDSDSMPATTDDHNLTRTVTPHDRPFLHHGQRPRNRTLPKFQSPRKRASKLYHELTTEAVEISKATKPKVFDVAFRVGDAVEVDIVHEGGVVNGKAEKVRGVVLGMMRKQLDTSILLRDVVFGQPVERVIKLHSPLVKSLKVLEANFVHKGKKKIKRAKLYYLSERNPLLTRVTKW